MKKVLFTFGLVLALGACGKKGKPGEEFVPKLEALKNEMCACKTVECADGVDKKNDALRDEARSKYKKKEDIDEGVFKQLDKLDDEMGDCAAKLRDAQEAKQPDAPPPAEPATP